MKKIINGEIVNTENMIEVTSRTSHWSHSNNPMGWETIYHDKHSDTYYLQVVGGDDLFSPGDNLTEIGAGSEDLMSFAENNNWAMDEDLIEWIENS